MKIAVTGPNGFVGRHVVAELEARGERATLATRAHTEPRWLAFGHQVVTVDIAKERDPFGALGSPDVLIHLAWAGLPNYMSQDHLDRELPNQVNFLGRVVRGGLRTLLVTGTCLEYGMRSGQLRETSISMPTTPYAMAKDQLRRSLVRLRRTRRFNLIWARLFYLYGRHQAPTSLYAQLSTAVERGESVFNMSAGEQVRDYLPVEEAARQLVSLAMAGRNTGIVNVCSGTPIRVRDLVDRWMRVNGWSISLNRGFYDYPEYEPMAFWGDRRKLDESLKSGPAA